LAVRTSLPRPWATTWSSTAARGMDISRWRGHGFREKTSKPYL
jgi:hypothetical protein